MSNKAVRLIAAAAAGALLGGAPGLVLVLLTVPVSGEAELTLGVGGIALGVIGAISGAISSVARASRRG